jgi:dynein heavy chain
LTCRLPLLLLLLRRYDDSHEQLSEAKLERLFLYSVAWSLGGLLSEKERPMFDAELRSFAGNMPPK